MIAIGMSPAGRGGSSPCPPPSTGWVRDPNWMPMPEIDETDEVFYGLLLVFENDYNLVTWSTTAGTTIDVGDGTAPITGTGSAQSHLYDYDSISATVYQYQPEPDVPARNYKQVMFTVTGTINVLSFRSTVGINNGGSNNFVDINCSLPNRTGNSFRLSSNSASLRKMPICERVRIWNWNGAYIASSTFDGMSGLRVVQIPFEVGDCSYLFDNCSSLDVGDFTTNATTITNIGRPRSTYQSVRSFGNIVANNVVIAGIVTMFYRNYNLRYIESLTSTTATSISSYATDCTELQYHGEINVPNCTDITQAFDGCVKLQSLNFTDCSNITTTTNALRDCNSLYDLVMNGLTVGINLSDTNLANYGMSRFANSIGTASGSQTITVTDTPFGALLSASDATALAIETVMTGKGYTIAN